MNRPNLQLYVLYLQTPDSYFFNVGDLIQFIVKFFLQHQ
jgi:hypothetical protein